MIGHAPLLAFFFLADIALPFLWLCSAISWAIRTINHTGDNIYAGLLHVRHQGLIAIVVLTVLTSGLAMCLRQVRHLAEVPSDLFWMPVYILFSTLFLMPVRLYGFIRLAHVGGWGTRADAFTAEPVAADVAVGAGGASATSPHPVRSPDGVPPVVTRAGSSPTSWPARS